MAKKKKKLQQVEMSMQDIWMATRPNIYANKKKYSRKDRRKASITPFD